MKVVITGSHFSPAYAVIGKSNWDILVVGRKYAISDTKKESFEYKICLEKEIPFVSLFVPRFSRVNPFKSFISSFMLFKAVSRAKKILKQNKADVVLSFGGYTALPVVIAGFLLKKPVFIHEQTLGAGFSNKLSSYFANRIFISFNSSRKYFPKKKTYLTGNPIREEILNAENAKPVIKTDKKIIYVTGGSTGSLAVNDLIKKIRPDLANYFIIHQHGSIETENIANSENYLAKPFFSPQEVGWIMQNASLIISRSGINTVNEVLYLKLPAIFIPLPYGQKNEQLKNARYAQKNGNCTYFVQEKIMPDIFTKKIHDMIKKGKSKNKDEAMIRMSKATDLIINEIEKYYKKKSQKRVKN